jgi:O-methyltransferase
MIHADEIAINVLEKLRLRRPLSRLLRGAPDWLTGRGARRIRNRSLLVQPAELEEKFAHSISLLRELGEEIHDYLEFGVYNGTSLACMFRALKASGNHHSRLIGFDSFEGLPAVAATDSGGHWRAGDFKSTLDFTRECLRYQSVDENRVILQQGFFDETLTDERRQALQIDRASIIMIDCDLYASTKDALRFCSPAIQGSCVIFFDDWYPLAERNLGEKRAFDEWLAADPTLFARELFDFPQYGKAFLAMRGRQRPDMLQLSSFLSAFLPELLLG